MDGSAFVHCPPRGIRKEAAARHAVIVHTTTHDKPTASGRFFIGHTMTPKARICISLVLRHEGGLVDNPADPGGLTNLGISLAAYPSLGAQAIRDMTPDRAMQIYLRDYWKPSHCESIPGPLAMCVLDAAVNCGRDAAAKMLEGAVGTKQDGIIGPKTIGAANAAMAHDPRATLTLFNKNRVAYYTALSGFDTFGQGWVRRADNTMYNALAWSTE